MCAAHARVQQKKERVDRVINSLALQSCRNTHIGSVLARGISGGEVRLFWPMSLDSSIAELFPSITGLPVYRCLAFIATWRGTVLVVSFR